ATATERTLSADILDADEERDLAILKVNGPNLPAPLDLSAKAEMNETQSVYVIGFPFGEALGLDRNPAVAVGKATGTSIRRTKSNKPALVQLQGDLHPGNSGGPVVDADGHLVGVSVAKLRGTQIAFAIAPEILDELLHRAKAAVRMKTISADKDHADVEF